MSVDKDYFAYKLIEDDYLIICRYVEATDANLSVHSHKIYELYLRICTEFESLSKDLLVKENYQKALTKPNDLTIKDYEWLFATSKSVGRNRLDKQVGLQFWQPQLKFISPFEDWKNNKPLKWYGEYNKVKHNRSSEFTKASFENLTLSFAGLFLILQASKGWGFFQPYRTMKSTGSNSKTGSSADGCIFTVK